MLFFEYQFIVHHVTGHNATKYGKVKNRVQFPNIDVATLMAAAPSMIQKHNIRNLAVNVRLDATLSSLNVLDDTLIINLLYKQKKHLFAIKRFLIIMGY